MPQTLLAAELQLPKRGTKDSWQRAVWAAVGGLKVVRILQNSSKTFLNNLAQELKIANAAQHGKVILEKKGEKLLYAKFSGP